LQQVEIYNYGLKNKAANETDTFCMPEYKKAIAVKLRLLKQLDLQKIAKFFCKHDGFIFNFSRAFAV
jgi:hypothetical protein